MENDIFSSEIGSGFGELGGTPPPRIPRCTNDPLPPPPGVELLVMGCNVVSSFAHQLSEKDKDLVWEPENPMRSVGL